jgi:thioredoxin 1
MTEGIVDVDDGNFETEVLQTDKPVMVDFWAPWCEKVKFAKCNVDNSPVTPSKYGIKAIPTLIFFKNGDVVEQITGMVAKSKLEDALNKVV